MVAPTEIQAEGVIPERVEVVISIRSTPEAATATETATITATVTVTETVAVTATLNSEQPAATAEPLGGDTP